MSEVVKTGVLRFEGAIFSKWYGYASKGTLYRESPKLRFSKTRARLDAWKLARSLGWK